MHDDFDMVIVNYCRRVGGANLMSTMLWASASGMAILTEECIVICKHFMCLNCYTSLLWLKSLWSSSSL